IVNSLMLFGLEFPPIGEIVDWKPFGGTGLNKTGVLFIASMLITLTIFFVAGRRKALVPKGVQNIAESGVEFINDSVILQTMGPEGLNWSWYLTTLFFFLLFANIFEVVPFIQFPATSRMAMPLVLALITWFLYNFVGIKHQGLGGYLKSSLFPP